MLEDEHHKLANDRAIRHLRQLLLISAGGAETAEWSRPEALNSRADWDLLTDIAVHHRVAPLLFQQLKRQPAVPEALTQIVENVYLATARRNLFLFHELRIALRLLQAAAIPAIVLKGAALAETVYGNIALRPMLDLDLLVSRADAERAIEILETVGYTRQTEPHPGAALAYENEVALYRPSLEPYLLEIHWSLFDSPYYQQMSMDWFWESAQVVDTPFGQLRVLGPEAQVLHLCGHMALHHPQGPNLLWMHDLAIFIHTHEADLDWALLLEKTRKSQLVLSVGSILELLSTQWQVPIPASVLETLQAMDALPEELRAFKAQTTVSRSVAQRFWSDLSQMPAWRGRLHYAWISLFPSPVYMRERYQMERLTFLPLLYVYRLWLGLRSGVTAVWIKAQKRKHR